MTSRKRNPRTGSASPAGSKKAAGMAQAGAGEAETRPRADKQQLQRAARRPRSTETEADDAGGRLFVSALARGLDVLSAFRARDRALGNQELAERTGLPKPTISRITHTLTQLGYLSYDARSTTYQLGSRAISLSYAALANLDVRNIARPIMTELAETNNLHVALGTRDQLMILNIETCEGHGLVGLRLPSGSRVPMAITAIGKAYLAAISDDERNKILSEISKQHGSEWRTIVKSVERSIGEIEKRGFCTSAGEWRKDINAVGAAIIPPGGGTVYALSFGGPAYLVSQEQLEHEYGPAIAAAAKTISASLGA
ncbi:IclR family transcriptional regulator [Bradyrhizobium liaoningense]